MEITEWRFFEITRQSIFHAVCRALSVSHARATHGGSPTSHHEGASSDVAVLANLCCRGRGVRHSQQMARGWLSATTASSLGALHPRQPPLQQPAQLGQADGADQRRRYCGPRATTDALGSAGS
ncbi:hypothetical protein QAD02_024405 [Eretmocerus hayati]|uniref:Uncharacterized protein n=1 Tax=Eretmocerus hayati TaxID=131215 RepID=A0ACC2PYX4_9HYME|nr:hypothetical protein QAD02_024405 [Eretmocerus hayati]